MIKKMLKIIVRPIYSIFMFSSFRYSDNFWVLRSFFTYSEREQLLDTAMEYIKRSGLEGDYLEFGVYKGDSFTWAFHFAQGKNLKSMKFYAFDSFEGLPETTGVDADGFRHFNKGEYFYDVDKFRENICKRGVKLSKVQIIPGWFKEVLNDETKKNLKIKKASIVYVDCDLYESTVSVLNFITDYVQDGTIIIFDDWFCYRGNPERGEQKAFKEWLVENPSIRVSEYHKFSWHGNSFIIHREY